MDLGEFARDSSAMKHINRLLGEILPASDVDGFEPTLFSPAPSSAWSHTNLIQPSGETDNCRAICRKIQFFLIHKIISEPAGCCAWPYPSPVNLISVLDSYMFLGKSDGDVGNVSFQRGREPPVNCLHKIQVTLLNLPRDCLEAAAQHRDLGRGKTDQELFGRCIGILFQCRIWNRLGIQQLRVWQKIAAQYPAQCPPSCPSRLPRSGR